MEGRETHATAAAGQKRGGKRKKGQCCSIVFCSSLPSSVARFHPPTPLCHGVVSCGTCHTARCFALIGALFGGVVSKIGDFLFLFLLFFLLQVYHPADQQPRACRWTPSLLFPLPSSLSPARLPLSHAAAWRTFRNLQSHTTKTASCSGQRQSDRARSTCSSLLAAHKLDAMGWHPPTD